jgi:hypothetical protein
MKALGAWQCVLGMVLSRPAARLFGSLLLKWYAAGAALPLSATLIRVWQSSRLEVIGPTQCSNYLCRDQLPFSPPFSQTLTSLEVVLVLVVPGSKSAVGTEPPGDSSTRPRFLVRGHSLGRSPVFV